MQQLITDRVPLLNDVAVRHSVI